MLPQKTAPESADRHGNEAWRSELPRPVRPGCRGETWWGNPGGRAAAACSPMCSIRKTSHESGVGLEPVSRLVGLALPLSLIRDLPQEVVLRPSEVGHFTTSSGFTQHAR